MPYRLLHRYFSTVAWVVLASLSIALTAHSQDYLGVLNEMLTPEVTAQLQLTEEQQVELKRLVNDRRSAAIGLAQMEREAPRQQRAQLRQQFGAESERLAFQLLNPAQQSQLAKLRVQWRGMLALADADVARDLNLANWQQDTVAEWLERVNESRRSDDADRVRDQAERAIRQELSDSQWAAWQVLAGQLDVLPEPPVPPERNIPAETLVSQASSQEGGAQAAASRSVSETPIEDVRLTLNFNNVPWKDVIDWLAEEADLSVQNDIVPPGSFKYHDRSRTYSVIETLDLMNASLLDKGYTFFRQDRMLRCVDFESDDIAPEAISAMADRVTEEELASRGKYEPVTVIFALERLEPEDVAKDIEQLLSVQGTVFALPLSGQVKVTDMAGNVRTIAAMIKRAEDPHSSRGASIQSW
ncbi:MAG: hypothetical protein KDB22_26145, partial [Planctomycetales bacterium]|nr:hypothetical protein [Planctomycetales bacterium]